MISIIDLIIVGLYIIFVFIVAIKKTKNKDQDTILVNNRSTNLFLLTSSIISTNIGAGFFLSVAAESFNTGISFGVSMIFVSTISSLTFVILSSKIKKIAEGQNFRTIPELLMVRYNSKSTGLIASIIIIGGYLFVTALQFVGIGTIGSVISSFNFQTILFISGLLTIIYSSIGGIKGDIYADAVS